MTILCVTLLLIVCKEPDVRANANTLQKSMMIELQEDSKLYRNQQLKGILPAGATVEFIQIENDNIRVKIGNQPYIMDFQNVQETLKKTSILTRMTTAYPVKMIAKNQTMLLGQNGEKLRTIEKGKSLTLQGITNGRGMVDYLLGSAYIPLEDFEYESLVDGAKVLTYDEMQYKLKLISLMYPSFSKWLTIGQSVEGRAISSLTLGTGDKQILMDGSFHGREHMTTNVLMEMIDTYAKAFSRGAVIGKYDVKSILSDVSIVFVPMVNPDGVTIAQGGKVSTSLQQLKALNKGSSNFDRWKANSRGVDLNRQFDVNWHLIKATSPTFKEYKGTSPYTEPEAIAMKRLIDDGKFESYISYHSSGQILYWSKGNSSFERNKKLVRGVSAITGYKIMPVTKTNEPIAASEDYFTKVKDKPAMTIEIAPFSGDASVSLKHWSNVWKQNQTIGLYVANEARN